MSKKKKKKTEDIPHIRAYFRNKFSEIAEIKWM
jgi:hypothetical protein